MIFLVQFGAVHMLVFVQFGADFLWLDVVVCAVVW